VAYHANYQRKESANTQTCSAETHIDHAGLPSLLMRQRSTRKTCVSELLLTRVLQSKALSQPSNDSGVSATRSWHFSGTDQSHNWGEPEPHVGGSKGYNRIRGADRSLNRINNRPRKVLTRRSKQPWYKTPIGEPLL